MTKISAKIIADSINPQGHRITSFILTYPRMIHGELMTHRMFSRNSASSRAIPFKKMIEMVEKDPFIPIAWQSKHTGMQGHEYLDGDSEQKLLINKWLEARDLAVQQAKLLDNSNVTKQLCNRLLEPFMWHTVLVTATEFDNFFELRCPKYQTPVSQSVEPQKSWKDLTEVHSNPENLKRLEANKDNWIFKMQHSLSAAEIHIQALAEAMWDAKNESTPKQLNPGEWHIPFSDNINDDEILQKIAKEEEVSHLETAYDIYQYYAVKIATARCARLSYMTFEGKIDYEKDIALHDTLLKAHHASPFEHCARAMTDLEYHTFIKGRIEEDESKNNPNIYGWCNNLRGFIQYRYLVESQLKK